MNFLSKMQPYLYYIRISNIVNDESYINSLSA
jgi:hypothetical protein